MNYFVPNLHSTLMPSLINQYSHLIIK